MTTRKLKSPSVKATEASAFGYRTPATGSRMMVGGDDHDDDKEMITDEDEITSEITIKNIRDIIKERLKTYIKR